MRKNKVFFHESGFSLIEILVALSIFAFILIELSYLMISTTHTNMQARRITAATNLAHDKLEAVHSMVYASVVAGTDASALTEAGGTTGSGAIYNRSWTVTSGSPVANTKTVAVAVSWTDKDGNHQVQLQTIIAE